MNLRQEKNLKKALKQMYEITGRSTDDEGQTIVGNDIYAFRKKHKSWILIDVEEDASIKNTRLRRAS